MDLRALILVGGQPSADNTAKEESVPQAVGGVPFAFLDVLGASVLQRVVGRLKAAGISQVSLVTSAGRDARASLDRASLGLSNDAIVATGEELWVSAEEMFDRCRQDGADLILVVQLGAYVELDYEELIQHHIDKHCRMSSVKSPDDKPLGIFVLGSTRRGDAALLFRSHLQKTREDCEHFQAKGYVNALQTAGDFRRLGLDGLLQKNSVSPVGIEIKPGVWVGQRTHIHRSARVLAPAFIGAGSTIRAAALVTRNSVIEHHAEVDCGTVVENSTILPFTYVGAGLDVMHSLVGFRRIFHLARNVEVEVSDHKLVGILSANALSRTLGSTAALFAVLPKQIYRGFFGRARKAQSAEAPELLDAPATTLGTPDVKEPASGQEVGDFPSSFAVVRRYGEH